MDIEKEILEKYTPVIGLEVHAQLLTDSKVFAPDSTEYGKLPNTNISPISSISRGCTPTRRIIRARS